MDNLKTILRVGGAVLGVTGLMFVPVRNYVFDKGDLNAFADVAELGGFSGPRWRSSWAGWSRLDCRSWSAAT